MFVFINVETYHNSYIIVIIRFLGRTPKLGRSRWRHLKHELKKGGKIGGEIENKKKGEREREREDVAENNLHNGKCKKGTKQQSINYVLSRK